MFSKFNLQRDYTLHSSPYQLCLPIDLEKFIPDNDSVRLVDQIVDNLELGELYRSYSKGIPENQVSPRQMLKIVLYGHMCGCYSSRSIESACLRDINFMWLLNRAPAPDHSTIARFISIHFSACRKEIMSEFTEFLKACGEISCRNVFIDGTKIESCANKYTFVWKKSITKRMAKLREKIAEFVAECEAAYDLHIVSGNKVKLHDLKKLHKALLKLVKSEKVVIVHGPGTKKNPLQRSLEKLDEYDKKLRDYTQHLYRMGERNSYSKTDPDATFMRMKEDHMLNGQLKPGYNIQHAVDSEYIVYVSASWHPTDTCTLIPLLQEMDSRLSFKYQNIVADSGYESEENYAFLEKEGRTTFIKPKNYEISKTKKYKTDISLMENMTYDKDQDLYICKNNKELRKSKEFKSKSSTGYVRNVTEYRCDDCSGCPFKTKCIKGNNSKTPMEQRSKVLNVSKKMQEYRKQDLENILSEEGTQLRMNRSIQAEGSFAETKEDMGFRRYLYRGHDSIESESILIALARNVRKLHCKIQNGHTGRYLFELKKSA